MTELPPAEQAFLGYEAKIATELTELIRPMTDATPHPDNVRKHNLEKIAQSLQQHGQRTVIVVQSSSGYIVKGNGTYAAAQMLGWDRIAMSLQQMGDAEALLYLYDDNRASDLASYDRRKLRDGLLGMMEQPGLFDNGLWTREEFEDLDEELNGLVTLEPEESKAAFATASGESKAAAKPALPGERMRDVSIVLTIADHTMFVQRVKLLAQRYGTGGTIATIVEAVRRQASAESADTVQTGAALTEEAEYNAKREVVRELRDYVATMGPDRSFSGTWLMAQLERLVPYRNPKVADQIVPGQTGAFEEPESVSESAQAADVGPLSRGGSPSPAEAVTDSGLPSGPRPNTFHDAEILRGMGAQPDPEVAALVNDAALATAAFSDDELEQAQRDARLEKERFVEDVVKPAARQAAEEMTTALGLGEGHVVEAQLAEIDAEADER